MIVICFRSTRHLGVRWLGSMIAGPRSGLSKEWPKRSDEKNYEGLNFGLPYAIGGLPEPPGS